MNFEQLQSAWAAQPAVSAPVLDAAEVKRVILPEFNRRRRMLRYELFLTVTLLVVLPLLAVGNYRYAPPAHPFWYWFYHLSLMVFLVASVAAIVRAGERQAAWREQCTRSLRDLAVAALAGTEAEMAACRKGLILVPLFIAFQCVDLYLRPIAGSIGWNAFAPRAALVLGYSLVVGAVFWRHYRVNLVSARNRQRAQLRELS